MTLSRQPNPGVLSFAAEENWRKTNPSLFIKSHTSDPKTAQGAPWTIQEAPASPQELLDKWGELPCMGQGTGLSLEDAKRMALILVDGSQVLCWYGPEVKGVSLSAVSKPQAPLQPLSPISGALSHEIQSHCPQSLVVSIGPASEPPLVALFHQPFPQGSVANGTVSGGFCRTHFHVQDRAQAQVLLCDTTHRKSHHSTFWTLGAQAHVSHLWVLQAHPHMPSPEDGSKDQSLVERHVSVGPASVFQESQIYSPTGLCRVNSLVSLDNPAAEYVGSGVALVGGTTVFDFEPIQEHRAPKSTSRYSLKMLAAGRGHGIFQGLVHILRSAEDCTGSQENKNLLLNPRARVDASPRLEILPNAVACKHGSATGELDAQQVFYLCSRGFSPEKAKAIVLHSFVETQLQTTPQAFGNVASALLDKALGELAR